MHDAIALSGQTPEPQFAALVDMLAADCEARASLIGLLLEDHPCYDQRGTAVTVRMRGWVLMALARQGVTDDALVFILEELDTGMDAYLVAAAARVLRCYPQPSAAFAPFVMRALAAHRYRDEMVSLESYGEYPDTDSPASTTPLRELLATLAWLGPQAGGVLAEVEALRDPSGGLPRRWQPELELTLAAIRSASPTADDSDCCKLPESLGGLLAWARGLRPSSAPVEQVKFEDQDGMKITFAECFRGRPSIVVFFYTRCDNPQKCSLTVTKLAHIQKELAARGLSDQIHTAAITYDPAFDLPQRLRRYGEDRGFRPGLRHRLLRPVNSADTLRRHFRLGVNYIESLVNRHRIELYVLDAGGRVAACFERIHWVEQDVIDSAIALLDEQSSAEPLPKSPRQGVFTPLLATLASAGLVFFPKCPLCWAGYMSVFGIAGLEKIPYTPWLQPLLASLMLLNLVCVWFRSRHTGRLFAFYLVCAGALLIALSRLGDGWDALAPWGIVLTLAGSLWSAMSPVSKKRLATVKV